MVVSTHGPSVVAAVDTDTTTLWSHDRELGEVPLQSSKGLPRMRIYPMKPRKRREDSMPERLRASYTDHPHPPLPCAKDGGPLPALNPFISSGVGVRAGMPENPLDALGITKTKE